MTFIEAVLSGRASIQDVDDWIERWHKGAGQNQALYEYLGMTFDEFDTFAKDESAIHRIVERRIRDGQEGVRMADKLDELASPTFDPFYSTIVRYFSKTRNKIITKMYGSYKKIGTAKQVATQKSNKTGSLVWTFIVETSPDGVTITPYTGLKIPPKVCDNCEEAIVENSGAGICEECYDDE